ncbi:MAG: hypothetical protein NVSMB37_2580 [Candidatus Saccharimonadales bacterium]
MPVSTNINYDKVNLIMKQILTRDPKDYIMTINMDGLSGRMLHLPAPKNKKRQILFVYGHHSSLERWWGVVQDLNQYGAVTMPDLPGFGGMDSFYKHGDQPTIDNLADYLAAFIKLRYRRQRLTIAGMSFGFVIVTRMLQRYPELTSKIDMLVSVAGFAHHDDFTFSRSRYVFYRTAASFLSRKAPASLFKAVCLHPLVLRLAYSHTHNARHKFSGVERAMRRQLMDFEIHLWHSNDLRTHMKTCYEFLNLDNCKQQINLPVWHVSVKADRYFDNNIVEQHMRIIFTDFHDLPSQMDGHAPSIIADVDSAMPLLPRKLRRILAST